MLTMFTYALGGVDLDIMLGSSNPEASIVLSLLYQFAMGTVLMSLLTGGAGCCNSLRLHTSTPITTQLSMLYQFAMGTVLMSLLRSGAGCCNSLRLLTSTLNVNDRTRS
jgi:hypothetical protein